MSIMIEEEMDNYSFIEALQPPLPLVCSKTPPLPPPPVPNLVPMISADAVGTLATAFPALSAKVQLNSILNRKLKSKIYFSDTTSLEGRDNGSDLPNNHISALFAALYNSSDAPLDDPKSELYSQVNMIVLGNNFFLFGWYGKSCTEIPSMPAWDL